MKTYKYLDGSGNSYIIEDEGKKTIEYVPVKPEYSSSGVYDGGEHIQKEISELQYDEITSIMDEVMRNKASHISSRVKTSGMIVVKEADSEKTCLLSKKSKVLHEIEKKLHDIMSS
jgi:hypothetical protein